MAKTHVTIYELVKDAAVNSLLAQVRTKQAGHQKLPEHQIVAWEVNVLEQQHLHCHVLFLEELLHEVGR